MFKQGLRPFKPYIYIYDFKNIAEMSVKLGLKCEFNDMFNLSEAHKPALIVLVSSQLNVIPKTMAIITTKIAMHSAIQIFFWGKSKNRIKSPQCF